MTQEQLKHSVCYKVYKDALDEYLDQNFLWKLVFKIRAFKYYSFSKKIIDRILKTEKHKWPHIYNQLNHWEFTIEYYDLIPKWWTIGMDYKAAAIAIHPVMKIIESYVDEKELSRHTLVFLGKMTNNEFEYYFENEDNNYSKYFERKREIEAINWWEDETYNKLKQSGVL